MYSSYLQSRQTAANADKKQRPALSFVMAGSFSMDIAAFVAKTKLKTETVCKKIAFDVSKEIIEMTPVDTGLAQGNWTPATGSIDTSTNKDTGTVISIAKVSKVAAGWSLKGSYFLTNSLSYIGKLEYGSSKQAPGGMVRLTLARYQEIAINAAR